MNNTLFILETAINAIFPVVLTVLLGFCLRKYDIVSAEFVRIGSKVSFNVAIPCMVFINVYNIESFVDIPWDVVIYITVALLIIFFFGIVSAILSTNIPERRGVILQASFRSNMAILGLSLASTLGGAEAVAIAAVVSAFSLPVMNILAVISLTIFLKQSENKKIDIAGILKNIAKNPLIIGIFCGMLCLLIRGLQTKVHDSVVFSIEHDLKFIYTTLNNIKSMASPFALLILGAQFNFSLSKGMMKEIIIGTAWRIIVAPLVGIGSAIVLSKYTGHLNFGVNEFPALVALFGTPAAVSSAIMAGQMKNDEQLATQLVVWSSIVSIITMFVTVCLLMMGGYLAV